MKKTVKEKQFSVKKSQLEKLKIYEDNFVMVKYSDLQLMPNHAKVLGFIRGMIKNNENKPKMKVHNKVWMKETTLKMAFLLGVGESTLKDHIKQLVDKGYLKRANHSTIIDNTNWYWIDEIRLKKDFKDHLLRLELELKQFEEVNEDFESESPDFINSETDNKQVYSQNLNTKEYDNKQVLSQNSTTENTETSQTILYNSNIISENVSYNSIEYLNNEVDSKIDINNNSNIVSETKERLDKKYCYNQLDSIFPLGWNDYLIKNGGQETFIKYFYLVKNYDDKAISRIVAYLERIIE
jgi:hypothetical protein